METATTVLEGTRVRGDIRGARDVRVEGRLEGLIEATGELVVEATGVLRGDVRAHTVRVFGVVVGTVIATHAVVLSGAARVLGDVRAPSVVLHEDASVHGSVHRGAVDLATEARPVLWQRPPVRRRPRPDRPPVAVMPQLGRSMGRKRSLG